MSTGSPPGCHTGTSKLDLSNRQPTRQSPKPSPSPTSSILVGLVRKLKTPSLSPPPSLLVEMTKCSRRQRHPCPSPDGRSLLRPHSALPTGEHESLRHLPAGSGSYLPLTSGTGEKFRPWNGIQGLLKSQPTLALRHHLPPQSSHSKLSHHRTYSPLWYLGTGCFFRQSDLLFPLILANCILTRVWGSVLLHQTAVSP